MLYNVDNKIKIIMPKSRWNPMGLAATVPYISCIKTGGHRTQKDIAVAAGITDVTLRNGFKDIQDKLQLDLDGNVALSSLSFLRFVLLSA